MNTERQYIPEHGKIVTLASIYDYTQHLPTLGYWSNLKVRAVNSNQVIVEHYNAGDTGELFTVPLAAIAKPVGWETPSPSHQIRWTWCLGCLSSSMAAQRCTRATSSLQLHTRTTTRTSHLGERTITQKHLRSSVTSLVVSMSCFTTT